LVSLIVNWIPLLPKIFDNVKILATASRRSDSFPENEKAPANAEAYEYPSNKIS